MRILWVEHVACMRGMKNAYTLLVWKPEGKKPHGREAYIKGYGINTGICVK